MKHEHEDKMKIIYKKSKHFYENVEFMKKVREYHIHK